MKKLIKRIVLLTTLGLVKNKYSGIVQKEIKLDDLFHYI